MTSTEKKKPDKNPFFVNNLVFAKVKGHPYWPAKIFNIDRETFKNVVKYEVKFFGTNEINKINKDDLCHYSTNKLNYTLEKVATMHRQSYKVALLEIEKEYNLIKTTKSPAVSSVSGTSSGKGSPIRHSSTPKTKSKPCISQQNRTADKEKSELSAVGSNKIEVGVNTTYELDLNNQLEALTDRCISLEKSLLEEKNKTLDVSLSQGCEKGPLQLSHENYHIQILKDELNKFKKENESLLTAIEILNKDFNKLSNELKELKSLDRKCLSCFPALPNVSVGSLPINPSTIRDQPRNNLGNTEAPFRRTSNHNLPLLPTSQRTVGKNSSLKILENKLALISDSHGRDMVSYLDNHLANKFSSFGFIMSNACVENIISVSEADMEIKGFTKSDFLIWIVGTNDIPSDLTKQKSQNIQKNFLWKIERKVKLFSHTNLILSSIPFRYDLHPDSYENQIIWDINDQLKSLTIKYSHLLYLDLWLLPRHLYTRRGFHFNKQGKRTIANQIKGLIEQQFTLQSKNHTTFKKSTQITEGHMSEVIEKHQKDNTVGFAHSISADYENPRQMSAGVAVVFRKYFGRPQLFHRLTNHLALQNSHGGAAVYSLITKSNYYGKPNTRNYDTAFKDLTIDFKRKGLKHLICSPMGTVRDRIQLDHFVANLKTFQQYTNAKITIVSYPQESYRTLRNGMSHQAFNERLHQLICSKPPQQLPTLRQQQLTPPPPPVSPPNPQQSTTPALPPSPQQCSPTTSLSITQQSTTRVTPPPVSLPKLNVTSEMSVNKCSEGANPSFLD